MATAKYTDLDLTFTPHPITNNPIVLKDEAAVAQAIKRIVSTNYGEVPFEYFKGGNVRSFLFEPADPLTSYSIKDKIDRTINKYEQRVNLLSVDLTLEENDYYISIEFEVIAINRFGSVEFNLKRIR